jgi:hypothetical protein
MAPCLEQPTMSLRTVLVVAALGLPAAAQSARLDSGVGLTSRLLFDLGTPLAGADELGTPVPGPDPRLSLAASMPDESLPKRPVDRSELDGALAAVPDFETMPGGIVLGTTATTRASWVTFELALDPRGLSLVTPTGRHYFPETRPEVIRACVAFVMRADRSDVVIDIDESRVAIAAELAATPLASAVVHADRAPHRWMTRLPSCKTVIVDDAITFAADPAGDELLISPILEVRVYVPLGGDQSAPCLISSDRIDPRVGTQGLVGDLKPVIDLAGFLGVLRWAAERQPGCLEGVLRQLAQQAGQTSPWSLVNSIESAPPSVGRSLP